MGIHFTCFGANKRRADALKGNKRTTPKRGMFLHVEAKPLLFPRPLFADFSLVLLFANILVTSDMS